ncbi:MAG: hypothetical protein NXI22_23820 [bacterium]|nr:hypothetical protein [bacterium]
MNTLRCFLARFAAALMSPMLSAQAPVDKLSMVLLTNGRLIQGALHREDDWSRVVLHSGGEIRLPADSIRFACRSPEDAYWKQRLEINPRSAEDQYQLAIWCLNEGEEKLAEEQIEICRLAGVAPHKMAFLQKRMTLIKASDTLSDSQISVLPRAAEAPVNDLVDAIHPRRVFEFTQTIQPLLLNHCGATACHGHRSNNGFQLVRPLDGQSIARKFTLGNLNNLLEQIGRSSDESLEVYLKQAHGGLKQAAMTEPAKRQVVNDWIANLHEPVEPALAASVRSPQSFLSQPDTRPQSWRDENKTESEPETLPRNVGADPFDPAVFNRKYHGDDWEKKAEDKKPEPAE